MTGGAHRQAAPERRYLIDDPAAERAGAFAFVANGPDRWRLAPVPSGLLRHYGGALVAQGLAAAQLTVDEARPCHMLHAAFAQPGHVDHPLDFAVTRQSDGRSFSQRTVQITQDGAPVLNLIASFHPPEAPDDGHQPAMPQVPPPETLPSLAALVAAQGDALPLRHWPFWRRAQQFDCRPVEPFSFGPPATRDARRHFWLRFTGPLAPRPAEHQRWLAYISDSHLLQTSLIPRGLAWTDDHLQTASLDHAIWFHAPARVDEWLLYALDSPRSAGSLGLAQGQLYRRDGVLAATVMQQGLVRRLPAPRQGAI